MCSINIFYLYVCDTGDFTDNLTGKPSYLETVKVFVSSDSKFLFESHVGVFKLFNF